MAIFIRSGLVFMVERWRDKGASRVAGQLYTQRLYLIGIYIFARIGGRLTPADAALLRVVCVCS